MTREDHGRAHSVPGRSTLSLASVLAEPARRYPDNTAVIERDEHVTYRELWEQVRRYAAVLAARGVEPGDRVAIAAPNVIDFVRSYYAVHTLGAVVVPVPLLLVPDEAAYLLGDSAAELMIAHTGQLELGRGCAERAGIPLITVGERAGGDEPSLTDLAASAEPVPSFATRGPDDPAVIFYTSGTTGRPKGAVLTQLNMVMNATVNAFDANDTRSDDRVLGCLPLFHVFGQTVSLNTTFRAAATLVLQPQFDPLEALNLIRDHEITQLNGVPTMYIRMLEAAPDDLEVPSLRLCISGGAALPVAVLERFNKRFGTQILEGYGLSETSPTATVNQPVHGVRPGTVGHPLWGIDVEIADAAVDERIELLGPGEDGEVVVRGHNVFAGYLGNPEATEAVLVDGWFRTGDIGRKDTEGFLSIVDRKKDLIIRNGYNVYPREVEELLVRHPGVAQAAVIGLPDEQRGEEICAVVVPDGGTDGEDDDTLAEKAIIEWAAERTAHHKYPRRVVFVDELPLGPSHKVLKRELRVRVGAGLPRS
ncbi:long-chain acyl-CoA synthetase [Halopolyspora algeriensis]|uniref:Long-chain acyl-CoA synthetase n=1 Tax=Halopolyspora algeriensis TaxID=1500506 RepID=A0A368VT73_9ACTN|nr:long-chain fatty acid--CoA ligase [Halopolyspora algeriensis]RCW43186.1 long-chain acyl-CoA synthetase [Halopolyspora algeriensis]TQM56244.1 long-chain acyl-CoA synthetase [Halopolyspora algeriensis]